MGVLRWVWSAQRVLTSVFLLLTCGSACLRATFHTFRATCLVTGVFLLLTCALCLFTCDFPHFSCDLSRYGRLSPAYVRIVLVYVRLSTLFVRLPRLLAASPIPYSHPCSHNPFPLKNARLTRRAFATSYSIRD